MANFCPCCLQNPGLKHLRRKTGLACTLVLWSFFSPGTRWLDISISLVIKYVSYFPSTKDAIDNASLRYLVT